MSKGKFAVIGIFTFFLFSLFGINNEIYGWDIPSIYLTVYPIPEKITEEQVRQIIHMANNGDPENQLYYGALYANGYFGNLNFERAIVWYERAAAQGNRKAKRNLAVLFQHGIGVDKDEEKALRLFVEAADMGDAASLLGISSYFFANKITVVSKVMKWPYDTSMKGPFPKSMGGFLAWRYRAYLTLQLSFWESRNEITFWEEYYKDDLVYQNDNNLILYLRNIAKDTNSNEAQLSLAQLYLGIIEEPELLEHDMRRRRVLSNYLVINYIVDSLLISSAANGNEYACSILSDRSYYRYLGNQVGREEMKKYLPPLENATEDYFRFLYARYYSKIMTLDSSRSTSILVPLAHEGNIYAKIELERERLEKLEDAGVYNGLYTEGDDKAILQTCSYLKILYIDKLLNVNYRNANLLNDLFISILNSDDIQDQILVFQHIVLPRLEFIIRQGGETNSLLRQKYLKENVHENLSLVLAHINKSEYSKSALQGLIALWVRYLQAGEYSIVESLIKEGREFSVLRGMEDNWRDSLCDNVLANYCAIRLILDHKFSMASRKSISQKIYDKSSPIDNEVIYLDIMGIFTSSDWNIIYMYWRGARFSISIDLLLFKCFLYFGKHKTV